MKAKVGRRPAGGRVAWKFANFQTAYNRLAPVSGSSILLTYFSLANNTTFSFSLLPFCSAIDGNCGLGGTCYIFCCTKKSKLL
jgi:hypothetical protein